MSKFGCFQKNKYPWLVYVSNRDTWSGCTGTLVASKYVITAAHCVDDGDTGGRSKPAKQVIVSVGEHDKTKRGETNLPEKQVKVKRITLHHGYNRRGVSNDIAILELKEEVDLETYTPACLARRSDVNTFYGKTATIAGWGLIDLQGTPTKVPHEVQVPVSKCNWGAPDVICAGGNGKSSNKVSIPS